MDAATEQTALEAAAEIHSDIARGFIRCEVISFRHLVESDREPRPRRGLQRLEGQDYVVEDGDVLHIGSLPEPPLEVRLHGRPVVVDDRVPGGVAQPLLLVTREHVLPGDALELRGQCGQRAPRAVVQGVRLELHADAAEALERVLQQEDLGLDVRRSTRPSG